MRKGLTILGAVVFLFLIALYSSRPRLRSIVRNRTLRMLRTHFASEVEFSDFSVSLYPRVHVAIHHLVLRHRGRTDLPPLVEVREVLIDASVRSLAESKPRITLIRLVGLQIHTPPRQRGGEPLISATDQDLQKKYPVLIEEIRADDAVIVILRAQPGKPPREFPIHHLVLHNVSFDRRARFHAILTNSVPPGEIDSSGEFGPWQPEAPSATPALGQYTFRHADLGAIKGIQGILSSEGQFSGPLDYLLVEGTTDTPNFTLRTAAHPMALHTEFSAIVDGTNGNTYLNAIKAKFLHTTLTVSGKVVDVDPEKRGRTIVLLANSQNARVEDLIQIAVKTEEPVMTGSAKLRADIEIPEGNDDLVQRLKVNGHFEIADGQFTSPEVQEKVDTLSRKAQGQPKSMDINNIASDMAGNFLVVHDVVTFSELHFGVPGASVQLQGTYNLDSGALNFHGKLLMQAKLSHTTTGSKSFFLKALDPFFKGAESGSKLAIKISGTRERPVFGLDHR